MPEVIKVTADLSEMLTTGSRPPLGGWPKSIATVVSGASAALTPLPVSATATDMHLDPEPFLIQYKSASVEQSLTDTRHFSTVDSLPSSARDMLRKMADMQAFTQATVDRLAQQVASIQKTLATNEILGSFEDENGDGYFDPTRTDFSNGEEIADWLAIAADVGDISEGVLIEANAAIESEDPYARAMACRVLANTGSEALNTVRAKFDSETNPTAKRIIASALRDLER